MPWKEFSSACKYLNPSNDISTGKSHVRYGELAGVEADFGYDNEGRETSVTYPIWGPVNSTTTYNYTFDAMVRPSGMTQGSTSIASGALFNAAGQLTQLTYAPSTETRAYNTLKADEHSSERLAQHALCLQCGNGQRSDRASYRPRAR